MTSRHFNIKSALKEKLHTSVVAEQDASSPRSVQSQSTLADNSLFGSQDVQSINEYLSLIPPADKATGEPVDISQKVNVSFEDTLNYSICCNNVSKWTINADSVKVKSINLSIIEKIIFRQSKIQRLREICEALENSYLNYAAMRVQEISTGGSLSSLKLVTRRNRIFDFQNELAVCIAHVRSVNIGLLHLIQLLGSQINKELDMDMSISVLWKNENVLFTIISGFDFLFDYPNIRYWIGFPPNSFMVPPRDHQPFEHWKAHGSRIMDSFLKISKEKQRSKPGSRRGSVQQGRSSKIEERLLAASQQQIDLVTDTLQLRDFCAESWSWLPSDGDVWPECYEIPPTLNDESQPCQWVQNEKSPFWIDIGQNPLLIEAAIGFVELFPSILIVPTMTPALLASCLRLQEYLLWQREVCLSSGSRAHDIDLTRQKLASIGTMNQSAAILSDLMMNKRRLKRRQQKDTKSLQSLFVKFPLLPPVTRTVEGTICLQDPAMSCSIFQIETGQIPLRDCLQQKVDGSRSVVVRDKLTNDLLIRPNRRGLRELSRLDDAWFPLHAIIIQRVFRGYMGRRRVRSIRANLKWKKALLLAQSICRGFIARIRARRKQKEREISTFLTRKSAVQRFRAAVLITSFMKHHCREKNSTESVMSRNELSQGATWSITHIDVVSETLPRPAVLTDDASDPLLLPAEGDSISVYAPEDGELDVAVLARQNLEKLEYEKLQARELVRRVNQGKASNDSRTTCRLIPPITSAGNPLSRPRVFSKKNLSILQNSSTLTSRLSHSHEVYVPPLHLKKTSSEGNTIFSSNDSRSSGTSRMSFEHHLSMMKSKQKQKEAHDEKQIRSLLSTIYL